MVAKSLNSWLFIAIIYLNSYNFVSAQNSISNTQQEDPDKKVLIVYEDDGQGVNAGAGGGGGGGHVETPTYQEPPTQGIMPHYQLPDAYQGYTILIPALEEQARQWYEAQKQVEASNSEDDDDDDDDEDDDDNNEEDDNDNEAGVNLRIVETQKTVDAPAITMANHDDYKSLEPTRQLKGPEQQQRQPATPQATGRLIKKTRKKPATERQTYRFPPGKVTMHVPPSTNTRGRIPHYKVGDIIYFAWSYMNIKTRSDGVNVRVYKEGGSRNQFYQLAENATYTMTNIRWNTTELVGQDPRHVQGEYTLYIYNSIYSNPLLNVGVWKPGELGVFAAQRFSIVDDKHADQEPDVIVESLANLIVVKSYMLAIAIMHWIVMIALS